MTSIRERLAARLRWRTSRLPRDSASIMRRRLTMGYVMALAMVAALSLAGSLVLSALVIRQNDAAMVINRAGAQRMLSQRIAALAVPAASPGPSQSDSLAALMDASARMGATEDALTEGSGAAARRTADLAAFYFDGPAALDRQVRRFVAATQGLAVAAHAPGGAPPAQVEALRQTALVDLLPALHQAVMLHEAAARVWVRDAVWFHWGLVVCTLAVLLLEAIFIFAPLTKEVFLLATRLDREARRDPLTGLLNRRAMADELARAQLEQQRGGAEKAVSVIAIDLDHFKEVNDAEGHAAGDALLCAAAERLRRSVRSHDLIARIGGDEFAVFMVGMDDEGTVVDVAGRIRDCLHVPVPYGGRTLKLGATLGVAIVPRDADSPQDGMRAADEALIRAKLVARGGIGWATRDDTLRVARVAAILRAFDAGGEHAALPGLAAHFQPIVSLKSDSEAAPGVIAIEALTRWRHPTLGDIPPAELIEALGPDRAARLGRAVRDEALSAFARMRPLLPPGTRIGLNFSAAEVASQEMIGQIEDQVRAAGLSLRDVSVEITEKVLLERVSSRIIAQLSGLRGRGATLVLDDFGAGHAGFTQFLRLELDAVKLERRFVQELGRDGRAEEIVRALLLLAHGLRLEVIAEGVETAEQMEIMRALGCDAAQGYLFAKPMSAEALQAWVAARLPEPGAAGTGRPKTPFIRVVKT